MLGGVTLIAALDSAQDWMLIVILALDMFLALVPWNTRTGLITALVRPQRGEVLVGGVPIKKLNIRNWRHKIGYIQSSASPGAMIWARSPAR